MTSRDFCYWLQGFFEVNDPSLTGGLPSGLSKEQVDCIKKHLALVFKHEIDPSMGPKPHQDALDAIHNAGKPGGPILRC